MSDWICSVCATPCTPVTKTKGSFIIEIILWIISIPMFCLLGIIYTIWRLTTKYKVCPQCGGHVIPRSTPRGQALSQPLSRQP